MARSPHPSLRAIRPGAVVAYRLGLAMALVVLAGCSGLPRYVPDLLPRQGPIQVSGTHGLLSDARSRSILASLERRGLATDIFERHLALEEAIAGYPLTTGNSVTLLQDGPATYEAMLSAIASARDHVNMETYILDDDAVGQRFAQALIDKQLQGVQVNLIHDSVGTLNTPPAFFERLQASGIRVLQFNPVNPLQTRKVWELNQRDHRKLLIVDGSTAFLGGINISGVYSSSPLTHATAPQADALPWRDTDLQLQGPVVADLQKIFMGAWQSQKGEPLEARNYYPQQQPQGRQLVRVIASSPDESYSRIYGTLISAIHHAQTRIRITNAYFVPDAQLLAALEGAAQRGVDVSLILPAQTDSWLVFHAGRVHYSRLLRAGVKIYERRGAILHSKTALIDGVWATVGSTNLDWRSFLHNHELNAVVLGADFGAQVQTMFDRDLQQSDAVTLAQWERRALGPRIKEVFARLWEYWL
jgi:cardiolipin synthase A/B